MNCERNICYQQEYNGGCDTCPCNRTADESSEVEITTQEAMETLKFLLSIERHHKEPLRMAIEALEKRRDCSKCRRQKYCTKACSEHARAISRYMTETE